MADYVRRKIKRDEKRLVLLILPPSIFLFGEIDFGILNFNELWADGHAIGNYMQYLKMN